VKFAHVYHSEMAQNFWTAIWAWGACFLATLGISLATRRTKSDEELVGLVYSMMPKLKDDAGHFLLRPGVLGVLLLIVCILLNVIFWRASLLPDSGHTFLFNRVAATHVAGCSEDFTNRVHPAAKITHTPPPTTM